MQKRLVAHEVDKFVSPVDNNESYSAVRTVPATTSTPFIGQAQVSGTATALEDNALLNGVIISAKTTNAGPVMIGTSDVTVTSDGTGNGYILEPGGSVSFAVSNTNVLYVVGTGGDVISFAGS